jgi:hypothetical protein
MNIEDTNEFNTFVKPEKPFMLINNDCEGHDVVFWFDNEDELIWTAKNNKALTPYTSIEIDSSREIQLQ